MKIIEDLEVYKKSRLFRKDIAILAKSFPSEEKYRLTDQILRSSRSITANIAEGYGRFHYQENIQYCRQARGSLIETYDHLTCALDEEYINKELFYKHKEKYSELLGLLNGFILYLKKRKDEDL
jgi:four helix bundle protein